MNKFAIPLTIRRELEKILKDRHILFNIDDSHPHMRYRLTPKNQPTSPFFFNIIEIIEKGGINYYKCDYLPASDSHLNPEQMEVNQIGIIKRLDYWTKLVESYNETSILFDDPITQRYYEDLETKFTIDDADADTAPYENNRQS